MVKYLLSGLYLCIALLFFMPFFNLKCNNSKVLTYSGKSIVIGEKPDINEELAEYLEDEKFESAMGQMKNQIESVVVRIALGLVWAASLFLSLFSLIRPVSQKLIYIFSGLFILILGFFAGNAMYSFSKPEFKNMLFNLSLNLEWGLILIFACLIALLFINYFMNSPVVGTFIGDEELYTDDQKNEP